MDYLRWYREVLALPVRNGHRVTDVLPRADGLVELRLEADGRPLRTFARHVVLATGRAGLGGPSVPAWAEALPRSRWAHSSDDNDYAALAGLRVGVVGAGASAMDSAATALEAGAARVHLLVRRADLPRINKGKGAGNPGFVAGYVAPAARLEMAHPPLHQHPAGAAAAQQHAARLAPRERALPPRRRDRRRRGAQRRAAGAHVGRADRARLPDLRDRLRDRLAATADAAPHRAVHPGLEGPLPPARRRRRTPSSRNRPTSAPAFEFQPREGMRLPGPRARALPQLSGDAVARRDHRRHPGDQRRRAAARRPARRASVRRGHRAPLRADGGLREPEILGDEWVAEPLPLAAYEPLRDDAAHPHITHPSRHLRRRDRSCRRPRTRRPAARRAALSRQGRRGDPGQPRCAAAAAGGRPRRPRTGCASPRTSARSPARRASRSTTQRSARRPTPGREAPPSPALPAMLRFAATLTTDPRRGDRAALDALRRRRPRRCRRSSRWRSSSRSSSYQLRVVAGLRALRASRRRHAMIRRNGFTDETLEWRSWLEPLKARRRERAAARGARREPPAIAHLALLPDARAPAADAAPPLCRLQRDHVRARRPAARRARARRDGRLGDQRLRLLHLGPRAALRAAGQAQRHRRAGVRRPARRPERPSASAPSPDSRSPSPSGRTRSAPTTSRRCASSA